MGSIVGIAGDSPPTLRWNAAKCEAVVWTAEGRVLTFINEWKVLGIFPIRRSRCGT